MGGSISSTPVLNDEFRSQDAAARDRVLLPHGRAIAASNHYAWVPRGSEYDQVISPYWWTIALGFVLAVVLISLGEGILPDPICSALFAVAVALSISTKRLASIEGGPKAPWARKFFAATMLVALPMFVFGAGISLWAETSNVGWQAFIGALLGVSALASVIQASRRHMVLSVSLPLWAAAAVVEGSSTGMAVLAIVAPIAVLVSRKQLRVLREKEEKAERRARLNRRALEILREFEGTGQGWFWETDKQGVLTYLSEPVAAVLGCRHDQLVGRPMTALFDLDDNAVEGDRTLAFHLSARSSFSGLTVRAQTAEQSEKRWWSISGRPVFDGFGNFCGFRGSGHDLTEKKKSQEEASRLAQCDSLTGLSNRHSMLGTLDKLMSVPQIEHRNCAVLLLDLDRFKQVNDTMGHPAGDALLTQVSQRLARVVGPDGKVGRLGGDEFKLILPGRPDRQNLAFKAQEIISSLSQPYSIDGQRVVIGVSVGIAIAPEHGETSEKLIRNADLALYAAKDGGRGRYHFFADDLHSQAEERRELEEDLRDAILNGRLALHYQPVVEAATEEISGFEALLRWNHPVRGELSPAKFVNVAEDTGLIQAIGEWVLRTACHDLAGWQEHIRVAVNISPIQFSNPQLPAIVTNAIAQAGISPSRLELEITEDVFLDDDEGAEGMFAALKRIGVRLVLDDFGTGYSSLGYLRKAPFDKIKIDQSFVRGAIEEDSRNGAIIASITSLAHSLGMDTTAEGVETLDELELVRSHGCSHIQGFIYEKALTAEAAAERLQTGLKAIPRGPRAARKLRHNTLRKVVLEHQGQPHNGTIRNISLTGASVQGVWNVPQGTFLTVVLSDEHRITAICRWSQEDLIGIEFVTPLAGDEHRNIVALSTNRSDRQRESVRKAS